MGDTRQHLEAAIRTSELAMTKSRGEAEEVRTRLVSNLHGLLGTWVPQAIERIVVTEHAITTTLEHGLRHSSKRSTRSRPAFPAR